MDIKNQKIRQKQSIATSVVGLFFNICLAVSKIVIGLIFQSVAMLADGVNNATDSASSLTSIVSFKLSDKPADKKHPYGHQRVEYIATLFIAFAIFFVAYELIKSSIEKIISGAGLEVSNIMFVVLGISIVVKLGMGFLYLYMGKKLDSPQLKALVTDSFSDVATTTAVLISSIIVKTTGVNVDGYFGIGVALLVLMSGIKILKDTINPLLGERPSKELCEEIETEIRSHDGVLGLHDLLVHSYGPSHYFASVHVEVDGDMDTNSTHELADLIEKNLKKKEIHLVVHIDPHSLYENDTDRDRDITTEIDTDRENHKGN